MKLFTSKRLITSILLVLISCTDEKVGSDIHNSKPEPTTTPDPATSPDETSDNQTALAPTPTPTPPIPGDDGWLLVPFEDTLDDGIRINSGAYVRVDFEKWDLVFNKQLRLSLSECGDVKLVGGEMREANLDSESINTNVGMLTGIFLYRPSGTTNPPSTNLCTLIAEVIARENGDVTDSKKKTFKIKEGAVKISQSKNPDNTLKPYFALDSDGDLTLSLDTQGAITDDDLRIEIYKQDEYQRFVFIGSSIVLNFKDTYGYLKGKIDEVKVCGIAIHAYEKGNLYCGPDLNNKQWLTTLPQGNHLIIARAYESKTGIIAVRNALLETGLINQ